jgi:hypothetical protein
MRAIQEHTGQWLTKKKNCQNNEYSRGYLTDVQLVDGVRVDVLGVNYQIYTENVISDFLHFHSHAVILARNEEDAARKLIKIQYWKNTALVQGHIHAGLDTLCLYLCYPAVDAADDIYNVCQQEGIGILLQTGKEPLDRAFAEVLSADPIACTEGPYSYGIPHTQQRSPGNFEGAIRRYPHLYLLFNNRPDRIYDAIHRPSQKKYLDDLSFDHVLSRLKKQETREALEYAWTAVRQACPHCVISAPGSPGTEDTVLIEGNNQTQVVRMRTTGNYIVLTIGDSGALYRIFSKQDVKKIENNNMIDVDGGIEEVLRESIIPFLR